MIGALKDVVAERLAAAGVPYAVYDGSERMAQTSMAAPHIVFSYDKTGRDQINPPVTHRRNPERIADVTQAALARIYARSNVAGARERNHDDELVTVREALIVALVDVGREQLNQVTLTGGRWMTPDELQQRGLQAWSGVVYELTFTLTCGAHRRTYAGTAATESTMGGAHGTGVTTTLSTSASALVNTDLPLAEVRIQE